MKLNKKLIATLLLSGYIGTTGAAQSVQVTVSDEDRVVVSVQIDDSFFHGNKNFNSQMGTLPIDGLIPSEAGNGSGTPCSNNCTQENEGGTGGTTTHSLVSDWGEADVVLDCYLASVMLYENTSSGSVLVLDETVTTDYCPQ